MYIGKLKGKDVALKVMRATSVDDYTEVFQKELQICTALKAPNVVVFYGACLLPPAKVFSCAHVCGVL